jgi:uncharacterized protein YlbG (UPF0298 family)
MREKQLHLFGLESDIDSTKKRRRVTLPLDTFLLLMIVIILLFAIAFSLGVEKGRTMASDNNIKNNRVEVSDKNKEITDIIVIRQETEGLKKPLKEKIRVEETLKEKDNRIIEEKMERYIIQVASYSKEIAAYQEAKKLEKRGFPVSVSKKDKYIVIYVGEFKDKKEAERNREILKKNYTDCLIRRL